MPDARQPRRVPDRPHTLSVDRTPDEDGLVSTLDAGRRRALYPDLLLLPGGGAMTECASGHSVNGYAVVADGRMLLVDTVFRRQLEEVRELRSEGLSVAGLVLTHRHVAAHADALRAVHAELRVPIYLHPLDAAHPHARNKGIAFRDPCADGEALLASFGAVALHFPGHTDGHVLLCWSGHGGVVFAGSAAVGPAADAPAGLPSRPPAAFSGDDGLLQRGWAAFDHPFASLCPYHGAPLLDRAAETRGLLDGLSAALPA
jgi:glyoxylase-like metal-dependent hydrolase (beta-lactamase superfamily II)